MKNKCFFSFFFILICMLSPILASAQEVKNALLIVNNEYGGNIGALSQPVTEARSLKVALESIGFNVTLVGNGNKESMEDALLSFRKKTEKEGGIAFFHYVGHAVQIDGVLYLIPISIKVEDAIEASIKCVSVGNVMKCMQGDVNVIIFDSSRNNPFPHKNNRRASKRVTDFEAPISRLPDSSIVIYSTESGYHAQDGLFTSILTQHISEKNLNVVDLFNKVSIEVSKKTERKQNPCMYNHMIFHIYLAGVDK
ncbi:MAG: caspase family protein [Treponema sp.]